MNKIGVFCGNDCDQPFIFVEIEEFIAPVEYVQEKLCWIDLALNYYMKEQIECPANDKRAHQLSEKKMGKIAIRFYFA